MRLTHFKDPQQSLIALKMTNKLPNQHIEAATFPRRKNCASRVTQFPP